ncbi:hypothetical protein KEM63_01575 [Halopseudomonas nanhaiensis]|uniref:outer membrane protein OmpK n=1 Tax=Halopseudomonas nanhaiensis TaxID=2830842 RepID=UPI001CC0D13D|nr:outer membrane protein OmpK [Halopseudomonas nanhaiensis]UAW98702.1 hypothetical protein KEM63_01575 [Halopseudomonas nanhaiensis]
MTRMTVTALSALGLAFSASAVAYPLQWQNNSLTYLYGTDFQLDPNTQQTLTFEHVSGWNAGDLFLFVDAIHYQGAENGFGYRDTFYGELSPRLSFGKLTDSISDDGLVRDVLLAATYEFGRGDLNNYLLGPALDLNIPGFDYFQLNTYYRRADQSDGGRGVWQITPVWGYTFPAGRSDVLIDGFIDWVVDNDGDDYHANLHVNPQIKYDMGKALGWKAKQFYTGVEYDYWKNKYGVNNGDFGLDTNQSAISLLAKYHF